MMEKNVRAGSVAGWDKIEWRSDIFPNVFNVILCVVYLSDEMFSGPGQSE